MNKQQFTTITDWQNKTFPTATARSATEHLREEVEELADDLRCKSGSVAKEIADCFILLYAIAHKCGLDYETLTQAIDEKMNINYARKWQKPAGNGVINHVRNEDENI